MKSEPNRSTENRIEGLDWLRGLMALGIMFSHYVLWTAGALDVGGAMGRLNVYGVSIFFVISGLSLAIAYHGYIKGVVTCAVFYSRRILKIFPLMWLATGLSLYLICLQGDLARFPVSAYYIFLNLTGLFAFVDYNHYLPSGAWAIGNELFFYMFAPVIIALFEKKNKFGNIFLLIAVCVGLLTAFYLLDNDKTYATQWSTYINPLNNFFFFVAGIALYYNFRQVKISARLNGSVLTAALAVFFFFPVSGDRIEIATGFNRIIFSLLSIGLVFVFWKMSWVLPKVIRGFWTSACLASYSIYLLHPIVWSALLLASHDLSKPGRLILFTVFTLGFSLLSYKYIESPFIVLGRKITEKILAAKENYHPRPLT